MPTLYRDNAALVRAEIEAACMRAERNPRDVTIVTVTKTVGPDAIAPLMACGLHDFGENRWQQARDKLERPEASQAVWHFIGRLQANKVKYILPHFEWIHSIDSLALAEAVDAKAQQLLLRPKVLIQVNVSGEESKAGIEPGQVRPLLEALRSRQGLDVRGLMTMAPLTDTIEQTRPIFRDLRELLTDLRQALSWPELTELSMGMSNDYPVAVEEGATLVRVGRKLTQGGDAERVAADL